RDIAPGTLLDVQLSVGPDQLTLADGVAGAAADLHALEDVEVDLLVMGPGGDGAGRLGVPDHDVGIGADADRALARIDVEDLGGVGGGPAHDLFPRQPPGAAPMAPPHGHAVLAPAGAVGDPAEVVAAHRLLIGAEAAMVGRRRLEMSGLERA